MSEPTEQDRALAQLDEALRQLRLVPTRVKTRPGFRVIEDKLARLIEIVESEDWTDVSLPCHAG